MLILLFASAFALSFAPLIQNEDPTAGLTAPTFVLEGYKATFKIQSFGDPVEPTQTFKYYIFDAVTAGNKLFEVELDPAKLTGSEEDDEIALLPHADKFNGKKEIFIDVFRTDVTPETILTGGRLSFTFAAAVTAVALAEPDTANVELTFTLDADIPTEGTSFVWGADEFSLSEESGDHVYSTTMTKSQLTGATSPYGYFKGADASESTLPFWVPNEAAPALAIKHLSATKVKGTVTNTKNRKVWIKTGEAAAKELTKEVEATYYEILYTDFAADAVVYFTDDSNLVTSLKQSITKIDSITPTFSWAVSPAGDNSPLLKVTVGDTYNNGIVALYRDGSKINTQIVLTGFVQFSSSEVAGESIVIGLVDGTDHVKSQPFTIERGSFTIEKSTAADGALPVSFTVTAGSFKKVPAGLVVFVDESEDWSKAKFYVSAWDATTAGKATVHVAHADWDSHVDKKILGYVTEKIEGELADAPIELSNTFEVFTRHDLEADVLYRTPTEFKVVMAIPEGFTAYIKTGQTEKEIKDPIEEDVYPISAATFAADAKIYLKDEYEVLASKVVSFTALSTLPTATWVVPSEGEDKTPLLQILFPGESVVDGTIVKVVREGVADEEKIVAARKVNIELAKLVGSAAHLVHIDDEGHPMALPLALAPAQFTVTKGTATAEKQPVSVQIGTGVVEELPGSLVVIAAGVTDWTKAKAYALSFDATTAGKLTGDVTIADWKDIIADSNVHAYVTKKIEGAVIEQPKLLSTEFILFTKETPKDDSAFSSIVSLMALFFSVLVFLL